MPTIAVGFHRVIIDGRANLPSINVHFHAIYLTTNLNKLDLKESWNLLLLMISRI